MNTKQIVFIDSLVEHKENLVKGVLKGTEVVILQPDKDGVEQITEILLTKQIGDIHIVSHGAPGCLYLGNSQLNLSNVGKYVRQLNFWKGNLFLYGCQVAAGDAGEEFIEKLEQLTGGIIGATTSLTGMGGDWKLDFKTGKVEVPQVFDSQVLADYAGTLTRLNGDLPNGGDIQDYQFSPDGQWVVYLADQDANDVQELYKVPVAGGTPVKLSGNLVANGDVQNYQISSDGKWVVYIADQDANDVNQIYSVPLTGGTPTSLNVNFPNVSDVTQYAISPDGTRVVYIADQNADEVYELYSVPMTGGSNVKLITTPINSGDVNKILQISPDGTQVLYLANHEGADIEGQVWPFGPDGVSDFDQLYSVPVTGGTPVRLNQLIDQDVTLYAYNQNGSAVYSEVSREYGYITNAQFTPDGTRVVYEASVNFPYLKYYYGYYVNYDNKDYGLYSTPVSGGTLTKLDEDSTSVQPTYDYPVGDHIISPDGNWVIYANQQSNSTWNLYKKPVNGGNSTTLATQLYNGSCQMSSNGNWVVYSANKDGKISLYSVPIAGGNSVNLNGTLDGDVRDYQISPDGTRVVYSVDRDPHEILEDWQIRSVPINGGSVVKLDEFQLFGNSWDNYNYQISPDSQYVVFTRELSNKVFSVPITGGALEGLDKPGSDTKGYKLSPDGKSVVYKDYNQIFRVPTNQQAPTDITFENANKFTDINAGLTGVFSGAIAWGDYDNDGDQDIVLTGSDSKSLQAKIYRNDNGTFTDINAGLTGATWSPSVAWADYDKDQDLDLLISGLGEDWQKFTKLYKNTNGTFSEVNTGLPAVFGGQSAWGDYDKDGDQDLLLTGYDGTNYIAKIYRNTNGTFTDISAGLMGVSGSAAWGDYDKDGDLDILLAGYNGTTKIAKIYRNDNGSFTDINAGLTGVENSSAAWGDWNGDGYLDVLLAGRVNNQTQEYVIKVYENAALFDIRIIVDLGSVKSGVEVPSVAWFDYERDGSSEILVTGNDGGKKIAEMYKYDETLETFKKIDLGLTGVEMGSVAVADYDNDGFKEILLTGYTGNNPISKIYKFVPVSIDENKPAGSVVSILSTVDGNATDTHTYQLVGDKPDNAFFEINGNKLVAKQPFDYEAKKSYSIRIRTTDPYGRSVDKTIDVIINNIADFNPTDITLSPSNVNENASAVTQVGTLTTVNPSGGNETYTYTLVGGYPDNAFFKINGNKLETKQSLNYEAQKSYTIRVATNNGTGGTYQEDVVVTIENVNEPATDIELTGNSIQENKPAGTLVGTLANNDPDAGDTQTYTIVKNSPFKIINGNQLVTKGPIYYYEGEDNSYYVQVKVQDAAELNYQEEFTVEVVTTNSAPTDITSNPVSLAVDENQAAGTEVGTLQTSDPNAGQTHSYQILTPNVPFVIENGVLKTTALLDYETQTSYDLEIETNDGFGGTYKKTLNIQVNDLSDSATINLTPTELKVVEGLNDAVFDVIVKGVTSPVIVEYHTEDGTAIAGTDYTAKTETLTFDSDGTKQITIPIVNDNLNEEDKTFKVVVENQEATVTVTDTQETAATSTLPGKVENLLLTETGNINGTGNTGNNILTGNSGNNTLSGVSGNDTLTGNSGNDILNGGTGADSLTGGEGNDNYYVDNAGDKVTENLNEGTDRVFSSLDYTLEEEGNVENLTLNGSKPINGTGNSQNNIIIGNNLNNALTGLGGSDALDGKKGADSLEGGSGNDTYHVDNPEDTVIEKLAEGTDRVFSYLSEYILPDNVENLYLQDEVDGKGTGNASKNTIVGDSSDNEIIGGAGNDFLTGGEGNDILTGEVGSDRFYFHSPEEGVDTITDFSKTQKDKLYLNATGFGLEKGTLTSNQFIAGSAASNSSHRFIYDNGALFYDEDGNGAGTQVKLANITGTVAFSDIIIF